MKKEVKLALAHEVTAHCRVLWCSKTGTNDSSHLVFNVFELAHAFYRTVERAPPIPVAPAIVVRCELTSSVCATQLAAIYGGTHTGPSSDHPVLLPYFFPPAKFDGYSVSPYL